MLDGINLEGSGSFAAQSEYVSKDDAQKGAGTRQPQYAMFFAIFVEILNFNGNHRSKRVFTDWSSVL